LIFQINIKFDIILYKFKFCEDEKMKAKFKMVTVLTVAAFLVGCSGPYDNTQAGAALGAVTGAVVGYNTGNHHSGRNAAIGAATGAVAGGLVGNAVDTRRELNRQRRASTGWR
jgi:outer membrane lipoprotein SlyB